jgi:hypothetical protein
MNKKRRETAVLNGRLAEQAVRQVNAEPWEPLPGMVRRRCGCSSEQRDATLPGLRGKDAARPAETSGLMSWKANLRRQTRNYRQPRLWVGQSDQPPRSRSILVPVRPRHRR